MKSKLSTIAISMILLSNSLLCSSVNANPNIPLNSPVRPVRKVPLKTFIPPNSVYGVVSFKTSTGLQSGTTCDKITAYIESEERDPNDRASVFGSSTPLFTHAIPLRNANKIIPGDCSYQFTPTKEQLGKKISIMFYYQQPSVVCPAENESSRFVTLGATQKVDFVIERGCYDASPR
jgi:hypothetical protein